MNKGWDGHHGRGRRKKLTKNTNMATKHKVVKPIEVDGKTVNEGEEVELTPEQVEEHKDSVEAVVEE